VERLLEWTDTAKCSHCPAPRWVRSERREIRRREYSGKRKEIRKKNEQKGEKRKLVHQKTKSRWGGSVYAT
jgi:hypothetical protein